MIKGLLYFAILTTVVVLSWIGFSVHHSYTTSTIETGTGVAITPIPSGFDQDTLQLLKTRRKITTDLNATRSTTPDTETEATGAARVEPTSPVQLEL